MSYIGQELSTHQFSELLVIGHGEVPHIDGTAASTRNLGCIEVSTSPRGSMWDFMKLVGV